MGSLLGSKPLYVHVYYGIPGVLFLMTTIKSDSVGAASIQTFKLNVSPSMTMGLSPWPVIDITDTAVTEKKRDRDGSRVKFIT